MITGTATYKDKSNGGFSFKNWKSLREMSKESNLTEIRLFRALKDLDCEIRDFKKKYCKVDGFYFDCNVGFCESLGEQGFIYTFFYDELPTEEEIKEDVKKYIIDQIKDLNGKLLSAYEENHLEAFNKLELKK